jgi:hypothetical protein
MPITRIIQFSGSSCGSEKQQLEELLIAALSKKAAASRIWLPHISIIQKFLAAAVWAVSYKYFRAAAVNSIFLLILGYL